MKAYKGFNEELKCRDFQYEVGKEYEESKAELCGCGFHACQNPLDVFNYYPPATSRYCEVEMDEVNPETSNDSKRLPTPETRVQLRLREKNLLQSLQALRVERRGRLDVTSF